MAKIKQLGEPEDNVAATPSEAVVKAANKIHVVTDSRGRKISVKRPGVLGQYHLVKMLGPELAKNTVYLNMAMPVLWVEAIDGEPLFRPNSELELEAALQRLDDEGLEAVMQFMITEGAASPVTKEGLGNS